MINYIKYQILESNFLLYDLNYLNLGSKSVRHTDTHTHTNSDRQGPGRKGLVFSKKTPCDHGTKSQTIE